MMVMEVAQLSQTVNNEQQRMRVMLTHWHHLVASHVQHRARCVKPLKNTHNRYDERVAGTRTMQRSGSTRARRPG